MVYVTVSTDNHVRNEAFFFKDFIEGFNCSLMVTGINENNLTFFVDKKTYVGVSVKIVGVAFDFFSSNIGHFSFFKLK